MSDFIHRWLALVARLVVMSLVCLPIAAEAAAQETALAALSSPAAWVDALRPALGQPDATVMISAADEQTVNVPPPGPIASAIDRASRTPQRPRALVPLYVGFTALQVLDARSTMTALGRGAAEANPLMGGVARHPGALLAVKIGAAAGTIVVTEKLRKRNPVAAVALMIGINSAYAIVVAHNYHVARDR